MSQLSTKKHTMKVRAVIGFTVTENPSDYDVYNKASARKYLAAQIKSSLDNVIWYEADRGKSSIKVTVK